MNTYPNTCPICKSPAKKDKHNLFCSNVKCKSWKKIRQQFADFDYSKIKEQGLTPDDPVIIICPKCNGEASSAHNNIGAYCWNCGRDGKGYFPYVYTKNRWYKYIGYENIFIEKHIETILGIAKWTESMVIYQNNV